MYTLNSPSLQYLRTPETALRAKKQVGLDQDFEVERVGLDRVYNYIYRITILHPRCSSLLYTLCVEIARGEREGARGRGRGGEREEEGGREGEGEGGKCLYTSGTTKAD